MRDIRLCGNEGNSAVISLSKLNQVKLYYYSLSSCVICMTYLVAVLCLYHTGCQGNRKVVWKLAAISLIAIFSKTRVLGSADFNSWYLGEEATQSNALCTVWKMWSSPIWLYIKTSVILFILVTVTQIDVLGHTLSRTYLIWYHTYTYLCNYKWMKVIHWIFIFFMIVWLLHNTYGNIKIWNVIFILHGGIGRRGGVFTWRRNIKMYSQDP